MSRGINVKLLSTSYGTAQYVKPRRMDGRIYVSKFSRPSDTSTGAFITVPQVRVGSVPVYKMYVIKMVNYQAMANKRLIIWQHIKLKYARYQAIFTMILYMMRVFAAMWLCYRRHLQCIHKYYLMNHSLNHKYVMDCVWR